MPASRIPSRFRVIALAAMLLPLAILTLVLAGGISKAWAATSPLQNITRIASGSGDHTCALTTGGGVKCWGRNTDGQLGDNTNTDRSMPVDVFGMTSGMSGLAAGEQHTCALTSSGGVECWGDGQYGQLGNGTTTSSSKPVAVSTLSSGVAGLAAGAGHTCALLTTGGVMCWGNNLHGQVGDGTTLRRDEPVNVYGMASGVRALAAGYQHTCALMTSGSVKCWGINIDGELGNGGTSDSSDPVDVSGITNATAITAGWAHTCALITGGTVECWGNNNYGQLGNGSADYLPHSTPGIVSGLSSASALAAGFQHTCALTAGGAGACWGNNWSGQLGEGGGSDHYYTPVAVTGLSGATALAAGTAHTCALMDAGQNRGVKCWGNNQFGQVGDGTLATRNTPVDVLVENQEGMQISKQASAAVVVPGSQLTYTLIVTNTSAAALHVTITDTLPASVTPGRVLTWTAVIPSPGGVWIHPVMVSVSDGYSGTLTNQLAAVSVEGPQASFSLTTWSRIGDQTIIFNPLPDKTITDPPFNITASASSGLPVTFTTSSTACSVSGNLVTLNATGNCSLTAHQAGSANYHPAPDLTRSFNVNPVRINQTITFAALPDRYYGDPPFTITATSSSGLPVTFSTSSPACSVSGKTVTILSTGGCSITAHQAGDASYNPAPNVTQGFAIFIASQIITFNPLPDKTFGDPPFGITATASSGLPVTFSTTSSACSVSGNTVTIHTGGVCAILAHQDGNANYYSAPDVSRSFTIFKIGQTITFNPLPDRTYGDTFFVLGATASSGLRVTYTTTSTACVISSYIIQVGYTVTFASAGPCAITAHQIGNQNYNPAPDVTQSFNIAKADQTIIFDMPLSNITYGDPPVVLTATASSGLPVRFGTEGGVGVCSLQYSVSTGSVLKILHVGVCGVYAFQSGDANYKAASTVRRNFTIMKAPQTITFAPILNKEPNVDSFIITATASSGLPVSFNIVKPSSNWPDTCEIMYINHVQRKLGGGGVCYVSAKQDGDQDYLPAIPVTRPFAFKRIIMLTISLYNKPADQTPYDQILRNLADAIYEMSNGTQYLGGVAIYQNWEYSGYADILWSGSEWPCSDPSCYGRGCGYIYMGDVFPEAGNYNFLANPQAGGYTLAHELGHYLYGLFDEYAADYGTNDPWQPHSNDWPVYHSIMNNNWAALTGDYGWLNFSSSKNTDDGGRHTAQDRIFSSSGWGTLSRPPWKDPVPSRIFMPELTLVSPSYNQEASLELPTTPTTVTRQWFWTHWFNPAAIAQAAPADGLPFSAWVGPQGERIVSYSQPVVLMAKAQKDQLIARAGLTVTLTTPTGDTSSLLLKDDGVVPDARADDGQYTGFMPYNQNGVYTVKASFDNHAGTAWFTMIAAIHSLGPHGETWVPTTQPVGQDFSVSASTQITITNWAADDHGDTPAAATELTLDDYSLPGRIDRPGDVDVFRVTPVVSGTLVVRVMGFALGLQPHIRLLAADGVTVLKSVDFNPHGDDYFFVRLEAVAGEPIYVEVRDQSGSASGGIYRVGAGDPLANFKEHVTSVIYLPMLTR